MPKVYGIWTLIFMPSHEWMTPFVRPLFGRQIRAGQWAWPCPGLSLSMALLFPISLCVHSWRDIKLFLRRRELWEKATCLHPWWKWSLCRGLWKWLFNHTLSPLPQSLYPLPSLGLQRNSSLPSFPALPLPTHPFAFFVV